MKQNRFNSNHGFDVFESIISHRRGEVDFSHKKSYKDTQSNMFPELEYMVVCKLILVDEIYSFVKLLCLNQERHQLQAYNQLYLVIEHFKIIDSCRNFVSFLVTNNEQIASNIEKNFSFERILNHTVNFESFKIDLVIIDEHNDLVGKYDEIKYDLYLSSKYSKNKKRLINLLIYCGILLMKSGY
jgi:hypothetical protein